MPKLQTSTASSPSAQRRSTSTDEQRTGGSVRFAENHFGRHPVRRAAHGAQATRGDADGETKVDELDAAAQRQHDVGCAHSPDQTARNETTPSNRFSRRDARRRCDGERRAPRRVRAPPAPARRRQTRPSALKRDDDQSIERRVGRRRTGVAQRAAVDVFHDEVKAVLGDVGADELHHASVWRVDGACQRHRDRQFVLRRSKGELARGCEQERKRRRTRCERALVSKCSIDLTQTTAEVDVRVER